MVRGLDVSVPSPARMWNYWVGGKDNISQELLNAPHSARAETIQARHAHYSKTALLPIRDVSGTYMGVMSDFLDGRS
jgi:S-adenosyl methyltransferase